MSSTVFQHKFHDVLQADTSHLDIGNQLLAFLKLFIYCLVGFKFFQLIFLKYRKQLSVSERVEKKYRYSHNQFFEAYNESQATLMQTTISNTIKNTQIAPSKGKITKKASKKQVSFKEENNSYHSVISTRNNSEIEEEEFKELQIQSQFFKEANQPELQLEAKNEEITNVGIDKQLKTIEETNSNIQKNEGNTELQSKFSQETQSSSQESTSPMSSQLNTNVDKTQ